MGQPKKKGGRVTPRGVNGTCKMRTATALARHEIAPGQTLGHVPGVGRFKLKDGTIREVSMCRTCGRKLG